MYSVLSLDVYSFAIILHEIIARAGVWGGTLGPDVSRAATLFTYLHLFKFIQILEPSGFNDKIRWMCPFHSLSKMSNKTFGVSFDNFISIPFL